MRPHEFVLAAFDTFWTGYVESLRIMQATAKLLTSPPPQPEAEKANTRVVRTIAELRQVVHMRRDRMFTGHPPGFGKL